MQTELNRKGTLRTEEDIQQCSQGEFRHTPFQLSEWEVVGERIKEKHFVPMDIEVLDSRDKMTDPMFEDFGSLVPRGAEKMFHAGQQAPYTEEQVATEPTADQLAAIEERIKQAYEEGRVAGKAEGEFVTRELIEQRYEQISARVQEISQQLGQETKLLYAKVERQAVQLALNVSKRILETTAAVKPDYIVEVIRAGMSQLGAAKPLKVRVSPDDFEFLTVVGLPTELSAEELGVEYIADELVRSGCVVETDFGEVDLQLEHMWEQIKDSLYEVYK